MILLHDQFGRIAWQLRDDKPDVPSANCWGIFGGWIEPGEVPQEAILREVQEELSFVLELSKLEYLGSYRIYPEVIAHIYTYYVTDGLRNAVLGEGQRFEFLINDDLQGKSTVPRHLALAEWYMKGNRESFAEIQAI